MGTHTLFWKICLLLNPYLAKWRPGSWLLNLYFKTLIYSLNFWPYLRKTLPTFDLHFFSKLPLTIPIRNIFWHLFEICSTACFFFKNTEKRKLKVSPLAFPLNYLIKLSRNFNTVFIIYWSYANCNIVRCYSEN